jgi:antitoxin component HigA of HigAB toxin-antitoxin module
MRQKTLDYLESHQSKTPSKWRDEANWRRENKVWLRHSQHIAVKMLSFMKRENLTQHAMAERMNCTQQYVSKILRGTENLTLETLSKLEEVMQTQLIVD